MFLSSLKEMTAAEMGGDGIVVTPRGHDARASGGAAPCSSWSASRFERVPVVSG
jgi:hypothetical protein